MNMDTNGRFVIGLLLAVLMSVMAWTLGVMSRIAVLEQRADSHSREMVEMKVEMKDHRMATELNRK